MTSAYRLYADDRSTEAEEHASSKSHQSASWVGIALLVSALFLQRFSLPFGDTFLSLALVFIGLILIHQFLFGKLLLQYDRLVWFAGFAFVITCSLMLNFKNTMLTGYAQFIVFNSFFMQTVYQSR